MGELAGWMDENFVRNIFTTSMSENVQVKIIRDRHSGYVRPRLIISPVQSSTHFLGTLHLSRSRS